MTLLQMVQQGMVFQLIGIAAVIVSSILLLSFMSRSLPAAHAVETTGQKADPVPKAGNDAVTVAITAAVNEYRKNKSI